MKKASIIAAAVLAVLVAAPGATVLAHSPVVDADAHIDTSVSSDHHGDDDTTADDSSHSASVNGGANAGAHVSDDHGNKDQDQKDDRDHDEDNASSTDHRNGRDDNGHHGMGELHRSVVAAFVHSLLVDADRDAGIGAQVRAVAQSQNDKASSTVEAMTKVENRSKLIRFLFGTDWSSLAAVKAAIVTTQNDIATLQASLDAATDAQVRADLSAQIQVLKDEQARMQAFVDAHEEGFSLLGWFTKLFAKSDDNA